MHTLYLFLLLFTVTVPLNVISAVVKKDFTSTQKRDKKNYEKGLVNNRSKSLDEQRDTPLTTEEMSPLSTMPKQDPNEQTRKYLEELLHKAGAAPNQKEKIDFFKEAYFIAMTQLPNDDYKDNSPLNTSLCKKIYKKLKKIMDKESVREALLHTTDELSDEEKNEYDKYRNQVIGSYKNQKTHEDSTKQKASLQLLINQSAQKQAALLEEKKRVEEELTREKNSQDVLNENFRKTNKNIELLDAVMKIQQERIAEKISSQIKKIEALKEQFIRSQKTIRELTTKTSTLTIAEDILSNKRDLQEARSQDEKLSKQLKDEQDLLQRMNDRKNNPDGKGVLGTVLGVLK